MEFENWSPKTSGPACLWYFLSVHTWISTYLLLHICKRVMIKIIFSLQVVRRIKWNNDYRNIASIIIILLKSTNLT
jgi:hypothetical protein